MNVRPVSLESITEPRRGCNTARIAFVKVTQDISFGLKNSHRRFVGKDSDTQAQAPKPACGGSNIVTNDAIEFSEVLTHSPTPLLCRLPRTKSKPSRGRYSKPTPLRLLLALVLGGLPSAYLVASYGLARRSKRSLPKQQPARPVAPDPSPPSSARRHRCVPALGNWIS